MGDIHIEETNYKAIAMTLGNLFMLLASIAIVVYGLLERKNIYSVPGIIASIVFVIGLMISVSKVMQVKVLLTITREGLIDNSNLVGLGFISFDDIKEFKTVSIYNSTVIEIVIKNETTFLEKLPLTKRRIVKRNIFMELPPVYINVDRAKDMVLEDIVSLLQKRLSDYSRLFD